ncbi:uncharacterized protein LOC144374090 [Ictidomys tridecemlineatus]
MTPGLCPGRYRWAANNINRVTHEGTSHTDTRSPARPHQLAPESRRSRWKMQDWEGPLIRGTGWVQKKVPPSNACNCTQRSHTPEDLLPRQERRASSPPPSPKGTCGPPSRARPGGLTSQGLQARPASILGTASGGRRQGGAHSGPRQPVSSAPVDSGVLAFSLKNSQGGKRAAASSSFREVLQECFPGRRPQEPGRSGHQVPLLVLYALFGLKLEFPPPGPVPGLSWVSLLASEKGVAKGSLASFLEPPATLGSTLSAHLQPRHGEAQPQLFVLPYGAKLCPSDHPAMRPVGGPCAPPPISGQTL